MFLLIVKYFSTNPKCQDIERNEIRYGGRFSSTEVRRMEEAKSKANIEEMNLNSLREGFIESNLKMAVNDES